MLLHLRANRSPRPLPLRVATGAAWIAALMSKEIARTVNDTVAGLPEELRTAITLREIEGLSYEEIATLMNCPIGTVRSRIFRARETIAQKLRPLLDTPQDKRW